jgi:protoporphyrinogen oxidase
MNADVGILGGGISGLSLAVALTRDAEVLEADPRPGGLARTFGRGGFWSDVGGHILFSKDQEVLDWMVRALGDNVARRRRNNKILYRGLLVKYPFENGLGALPREDAFECLMGFIQNTHPGPPHQNFEQWMYWALGAGITERYLIPYNRKIWKREPREMSTEWVERVPRPPLEDVVRSALGIETEGYTHQLHFFYPREGGIEALPRALAARLQERGRLRTGYRVERVRRTQRGFQINDEREYRTLVTTMPILPFLETLEQVPEEILEAARSLRYNSLRVVLLGIDRREGLDELTALYIPDQSVLAHRVCFNCAFSPAMAPPGCASLACEITTRAGDGVHELDDEALAARVHADLVRVGVLRPGDHVVERVVHRERFAYVVYDLGYAARVARIGAWLASIGVHAAGRFAEYKYVNMDACIRRTLDLARELDGAR